MVDANTDTEGNSGGTGGLLADLLALFEEVPSDDTRVDRMWRYGLNVVASMQSENLAREVEPHLGPINSPDLAPTLDRFLKLLEKVAADNSKATTKLLVAMWQVLAVGEIALARTGQSKRGSLLDQLLYPESTEREYALLSRLARMDSDYVSGDLDTQLRHALRRAIQKGRNHRA